MDSMEGKLVVIGDSGVGKTCIAMRFVGGTFIENNSSTIGASFLTKEIKTNGRLMKLQIWDTAGQERFRSMVPMYYRGAAVALLVFDICEPDTFFSAKKWVRDLRANVSDETAIVLVGNKADLDEERKVQRENAEKYAEEIKADYHEVSAKTNEGLDTLFQAIVKHTYQALLENAEVEETPKDNVNVDGQNPTQDKGCC
eukprot:CAMPEP_0201521702 /NCGR_PEP_ID=MMETSP0161_2-20130828/15726_1 /ASSEMBLY_ACC=CAM_ASM_000251 /TAXON_ID=180227 /ORGANISM="Neoparamoeba aestuarina, Strain SoJaBio B1-5/56/2" /LENGTH=198 /DNA_ID=CAMNT_0047920385 /DNA_START=75 /DNA_END=671 /DNA_ORIENTATION=+